MHSSTLTYFFLFFCLTLVSVSTIKGQISPNFMYDNWRVADGLPQHSVNKIIQTPDGYLWLATEGGLVRFDGLSFTTFDRGNTPAIYSNRVAALAVDRQGRLYFGIVGGGIGRYYQGVFEDLTDIFGIGRISVRSIVVDIQDRVWFSSQDSGIFVIEGDRLKKVYDAMTLGPVPLELATFGNGRVVATNDRQLLEINPNGVRVLHEIHEYENFYRSVITQKGADVVWTVTNLELIKFDGEKITRYPLPDRHRYSTRMRVLPHPVSGILVISFSDLSLFHPETEKFDAVTGVIGELRLYDLNDLFIDMEGYLWMGSSTGGLYRLRTNPFRLFEWNGHVFDTNSLAAFRAIDGSLWLTNANGMTSHLTDGRIEVITQDDLEGRNPAIYCFGEDTTGQLYAGSYAEGIYKFVGPKKVEVVPFIDGEYRWIYFISLDSNGRLWVGTERGLFYLRDGVLTDFGLPNYYQLVKFSFIYQQGDRTWFSSDQTILSVENDRWKDWQSIIPEKNRFFRGMVDLPDGNLLVGTYGNGLVYIDPVNEKAISIGRAEGLVDNVASYLIFDGNLWMTGNNGLSFLRYNDLKDFVEGRQKEVSALLFNIADGSPTGEFNGGNKNAGLRLHDNTYLFPSLDGVIEVDFDQFRIEEIAPPAIIEYVTQGGKTWSTFSDIRTDYSTERIEFVFTSPNFSSAGKTKFRYRLLGVESEWIDAGTNRRISYTELNPGDYTFQVMAGTSTGIWGGKMHEVKLHIVAPFYKTGWFNGLILLLAMGLFGYVVYAGVQRSNRRQRDRSALMDVLPDLIFKLNKDGQFVEFFGNASALNRDFRNMVGRSVGEVLNTDVASLVISSMEVAYATGNTQIFEYRTEEDELGGEFYEGRVVPIDDTSVLFIIRDITLRRQADLALKDKEIMLQASLEQKQALIQQIEEQQKAQMLAILDAQEKERTRIALDLHDSIGQMLSSVKMNLSVANQEDIDMDQSRVILMKSQSMIDSITQEIRNISYNLLPSSLKRFGLVTAIDEQIKRIKSDGFEVKFFHITPSQRYSEIIEVNLFRVFQESLNNSMKHSGATEISIQIVEHEQSLSMVIEDDGKGFDFNSAMTSSGGSGLKNIISRVNMIGGEVHFDTAAGAGGTTITILVPLQ